MGELARVGAGAQTDREKYGEIRREISALILNAQRPRGMTDEQRNRWEGLERAVRDLERARLRATTLPVGDRMTRLAVLDASLVRCEAERRHLSRAMGSSSSF